MSLNSTHGLAAEADLKVVFKTNVCLRQSLPNSPIFAQHQPEEYFLARKPQIVQIFEHLRDGWIVGTGEGGTIQLANPLRGDLAHPTLPNLQLHNALLKALHLKCANTAVHKNEVHYEIELQRDISHHPTPKKY